MKTAFLLAAVVLFSFTSFSQSNRPEAGDILVGLQFDPIETLRFIVNPDVPGLTNGLLLNGIDARRYSSNNRAHQFGLNWGFYSTDLGERPFYTDPNYTVSSYNFNGYLNASYAYLWLYNFGENWQLVYGPEISGGMNYGGVNYDYSGSPEEFEQAGQYGTYIENYDYSSYEMALVFLAEVNYFFSNSIYIGASWDIGARASFQPDFVRTYTSINNGSITEVERETPSTLNVNVFDRSGMTMKLGMVF